MKLTHAAVFEPRAADRKQLVAGLQKGGLKVTSATSVEALTHEGLVVFGPGQQKAPVLAKKLKAVKPEVLVIAASKALTRKSFADALLPLPVSPRDLKARLMDWAHLEHGAPRLRAGEGILDPLTNFYTFAHFKELLFIEVKRARRYGFPLAAAILAVDPLPRAITPSLKAQLFGGLALAVRRSLRDTDFPVQYNPDRVLLLMPHTDLAGALVVTRRICERVAHASLTHGDEVLRPTVSCGVAAGVGAAHQVLSFADLAQHAIVSLEVAREKGGNRVEFFDSAAAPGTPLPETT